MKLARQEAFKIVGYVGVLLLVVGYLRYSIQETLSHLNGGLLIAGGVLVLAALIVNFREVRVFFSRRSARLGANTLVLTAAVLAIVILINVIAFRHDKRFDMTAEHLYTLSDQTRRIVKGLNRDVGILRFSKDQDPDLREMMNEYESLSRHVHYELVDPQEKPEIARQYKVTRMNTVVAASGDRTQQLEETTEQDVTNAILKVTRDTVKTICFVEGHGEKSITSHEEDGYAAVEAELEKETYQVKSVNLVSSDQVPPECSVLVIPGPAKALFPQEAAMVGKFLDAGGKTMVLADPDTDPGLGDVFKAWNVVVGNNFVIDASGMGRMFGTSPVVPLVIDYGQHPITRDFNRTMTFFPLARTVDVADATKPEPHILELLKTSPASWATPKLTTGRVSFDPAKDTKGPLSLGIAADRDAGKKQARLVVIGNSAFATNRWIGLQRNGDLFFNSLNWLAQDEDMISVRPKSPTNRRVLLTQGQQRMLSWISLVILPGFVVASGILIWWKRR